MNRRDFLKTAAATAGALALPGAALASQGQPTASYTLYRAVGMVSGWTKGPHRDHYTPEAIHKVFEFTREKMAETGRLPMWENYDRSRPPIAMISDIQIHESREIQKIYSIYGEVLELIPCPGPSLAYISLEFFSERDDLEGKFVGPTVQFEDRIPQTGESPVEMMLGIGEWSINDTTKFQAPNVTLEIEKGGFFNLHEASLG